MLKLLLAPALLATMSATAPEPLEPCPDTPNCVSTQAERESQRMDPIAFAGEAGEARQRLLDILAEEPRVRVDASEEWVVRAVFTTRFLRFKDDVVFVIHPAERLIHFRSASRVGRSDLGVNRERMERLSDLFRRAGSGS